MRQCAGPRDALSPSKLVKRRITGKKAFGHFVVAYRVVAFSLVCSVPCAVCRLDCLRFPCCSCCGFERCAYFSCSSVCIRTSWLSASLCSGNVAMSAYADGFHGHTSRCLHVHEVLDGFSARGSVDVGQCAGSAVPVDPLGECIVAAFP